MATINWSLLYNKARLLRDATLAHLKNRDTDALIKDHNDIVSLMYELQSAAYQVQGNKVASNYDQELDRSMRSLLNKIVEFLNDGGVLGVVQDKLQREPVEVLPRPPREVETQPGPSQGVVVDDLDLTDDGTGRDGFEGTWTGKSQSQQAAPLDPQSSTLDEDRETAMMPGAVVHGPMRPQVRPWGMVGVLVGALLMGVLVIASHFVWIQPKIFLGFGLVLFFAQLIGALFMPTVWWAKIGFVVLALAQVGGATQWYMKGDQGTFWASIVASCLAIGLVGFMWFKSRRGQIQDTLQSPAKQGLPWSSPSAQTQWR